MTCPAFYVVINGGRCIEDELYCCLASEIVECRASQLKAPLWGSAERAALEPSTSNKAKAKNTRHVAANHDVDACHIRALLRLCSYWITL